MKNKIELFSVSSAVCCREYENVRDEKSERLVEIKMHCEDLWADFRKYADSHFVSEFCRHFHQRWFEMYLAVSLLRRGFDVRSQDAGPDILLEVDGCRIWIEAVCATAGEVGLPDSVPKVQKKVSTVPVRQYVLRILTSLQQKAMRFSDYIKGGMVCEHDTLAVAINIYGIDGIMPSMDNILMRALYGRGDMELNIDKYTGELKSVDHERSGEVVKNSGSAVGAIPFVDRSMDHVASALGFWSNAANRP